MSSIFPQWTNAIPALAAVGLGAVGVGVVGGVYYYFTPEFWEVGYQPEQQVAYSHQIHVGKLGIDCRYCHSEVENSKHANVPATTTCMNCHGGVEGQWNYLNADLWEAHLENPNLELLRQKYAEREPVQWTRIHKLPDYAHFNHAVHVNAGVSCYSCHGRIDQMEVVYQAESLSMAWCLSCHRNPEDYLIDTTGTVIDYDGDGEPGPAYEVTNLEAAQRVLADSRQADWGAELAADKGLQPPEHCAACHY